MSLFHSKVYGIVQGVGFRPFVDRLAARFHILGSVCNKGPYVEIFAQGEPAAVRDFLAAIEKEPPERAAILKMDTEVLDAPERYTSFSIIDSAKERGDIFVSPDIATCDKCRAELFDKSDRRYLHPFINCTACGPRLTILDAMPYDRERTSMGEFPMCPDCRAEYTSPETRRYDAQPVCCNDCGPEVYIIGEESCRGAAAITRTRQVLSQGGIVAIKGIGGFHLACDATNEEAIQRLRKLKHRPVKPFAVMLRDMAAVHRECQLEYGQEEMLTGHQKPILLLQRKAEGLLCDAVSPGNPKVGVMLPYAPVQLLLFDYPDGVTMPDALIMTSGNPAGAPICRDDKGAVEALSGFTDLMLSHNRKIRIRADDTVMDWLDGKPYMIRRSRGFAPLPFMVSKDLQGQVLGIGGELKNTFCVGSNNIFYPSPYVGDMSDLRTMEALRETIGRLTELLENEPTLVACDLHPRYNTVTIAKELGLPLFPVQHHYAHILSCMAENDHDKPVIGVSFDGTGYGTDGTIWGGEILQADFTSFTRLGHIRPFLQTGGDKASVEGWRIAVSMLYGLYNDQAKVREITQQLALCPEKDLAAQFFMADNHVNAIKSTSAGRLYDAVSAILDIRKASTFEGEASMYLEFAAERYLAAQGIIPQTIALDKSAPAICRLDLSKADGSIILATDKLFCYLLTERLRGTSPDKLAYLFHAGLAACISNACEKAREQTGLSTCALSGGVFQNHLLVTLVKNELKAKGFNVLLHSLIPPNDGGICLGQAVAAMVHLNQ
ncbi:Hydrogenase maturation protein, carbamoyltransferase HypF [Selenomonas sp. WCT3]|uniref:carbamoyltransferase HypF n=1 Tax=Selenomonas sp. WCT3 TaxID=3158785 RepID=UPI0008904535|nr:Hydrogenase maturation protein, carbamoyltransferase HypF [Selenomonas ruminantium]